MEKFSEIVVKIIMAVCLAGSLVFAGATLWAIYMLVMWIVSK